MSYIYRQLQQKSDYVSIWKDPSWIFPWHVASGAIFIHPIGTHGSQGGSIGSLLLYEDRISISAAPLNVWKTTGRVVSDILRDIVFAPITVSIILTVVIAFWLAVFKELKSLSQGNLLIHKYGKVFL